MAMADVLAAHGFRIHLVEEDTRLVSYDALINGIPADFKRTSSHNNIKKYAKRATQKQQAIIIVFQLDAETHLIHWELEKLSRKGFHLLYFFTKDPKQVYSLKIGQPCHSRAEQVVRLQATCARRHP